jgi:hypothetical protein
MLKNVKKIRKDIVCRKKKKKMERKKMGDGWSEDEDDISKKGEYGLKYENKNFKKNSEEDDGKKKVNV